MNECLGKYSTDTRLGSVAGKTKKEIVALIVREIEYSERHVLYVQASIKNKIILTCFHRSTCDMAGHSELSSTIILWRNLFNMCENKKGNFERRRRFKLIC